MSLRRKTDGKDILTVQALAESGFKTKAITKITKLAPSSVAKILTDTEKDSKNVGKYVENRLSVLQKGQLSALGLQQSILDSMKKDMSKLTKSEKISLFKVLTADFGIKYDKERLESGQSTENVSKVIKLIREIKKHGKLNTPDELPAETNLQIEDQGEQNGTSEDFSETDESAVIAQQIKSIQSNLHSNLMGLSKNRGLIKQDG